MHTFSSYDKHFFAGLAVFVLLLIASPTFAQPTDPTPPEPSSALPAAVAIPQGPVPDQIIVRFTPQTSAQERRDTIDSLGGTVIRELGPLHAVVLEIPAPQTAVAQVATALMASPLVAQAEPNYYAAALVEPVNDPLYPGQWGLPVVGAPDAWSTLTTDNPTVAVAVVDSGICAGHVDLAGRVLPGYDFVEDDAIPQDDFGHGCAVSGVIAANGNNAEGMAGVAPNTAVLPVRVLGATGTGSYADVAAGILYAADHGAQIINLSLGGASPSSTLEDAVNYAVAQGVMVVAAAGNTGQEGVLYPAAYAPVIAVGSVDADLQQSSFSTYGPEIDLWAPGRDIFVTLGSSYTAMSGTSFAAPHVSGVAALEMAAGRQLALDGGIVQAGSGTPINDDSSTSPTEPAPDAPQTVNVHSTVALPQGVDTALAQAALTDIAQLAASDIFVVSLDRYNDWAIGTVIIGDPLSAGDPLLENSTLAIVQRRPDQTWEAAFLGSTRYGQLLDSFPSSAISEAAKAFLLPAAASSTGTSAQSIPTSLKFPWMAPQMWALTNGIHANNNSALDFAPLYASNPAERYVVASAPGVVIRYCTGANQAWVMVRHPSGGSNDYWTGYLHLDRNTVNLSTGMPVDQGDILGITYNSGGTEVCNPYSWNVTSSGPHAHFSVGTITAGSNSGSQITSVPIAGTVISGWTVGTDSCLRKSGYTRCAGSQFQSDNTGIGTIPPPPNDDFDAATPIPAMPYNTTLDTRGATVALDDPPLTNCNRTAGFASVWYRYTPPTNGVLFVDTIGSDRVDSDYDTMLAVWGGSRGSLTPVACNDDIGWVNGSYVQDARLFTWLAAGTTYYIEVSTYSGELSAASNSASDATKSPQSADVSGLSSLGGQLVLHAAFTPAEQNLVYNPSFNAGVSGWGVTGNLVHGVSNGVMEVYRPVSSASGSLYQAISAPATGGMPFQATVRLGNRSGVDKAVNVVLRNSTDWTGALSCSFTIPANSAPYTYTLRGNAGAAWPGILFQVDVLSADGAAALQVDDVDVRYRPGLTVGGTQCVPPVVLAAPKAVTTGPGNPTYQWNDIANATTYDLWLGKNGQAVFFDQNLSDATYCNGTTCSVDMTTRTNAAWLTNGTYTAWMRARNGSATIADWSGPFQINVAVPPPAPATLNAVTEVTSTTPVLNWTLNGSAAYSQWFHLFIAPVDAAGKPGAAAHDGWHRRDATCGSFASTTCAFRSPVALQTGQRYVLWMQSWGPGGMSAGGAHGNGWAGPVYFNIGGDAPSVPQNLAVSTDLVVPSISWSDDAKATRFQIVMLNSGGETVYNRWHEKDVPGDGLTCNGTVCRVIPHLNLSNGAYTVWARAEGPGGYSYGGNNGGWTKASFTLNLPQPSPVTLQAVTNTASTTPTLNWTLDGNAAYASWFHLVIIPVEPSGAAVYDGWHRRDATCGSIASTTCAFAAPVALQPGHQYMVWMQSWGPGGMSIGGAHGNGWSNIGFTITP